MKKAKIVLVNPRDTVTPRSCYRTEHLGLAYIASGLRKQGHTVKLIDADALDISDQQVMKEIIDFSPQIVGLSPTYLTFQNAITIAHGIKEMCKQTHICMGGHQATFATGEILSNEFLVDSIVRGEGEAAMVELANRLSQNHTLKGATSICYRENGRIIQNPTSPLDVSLDEMPFPARDTLAACYKKGTTHAAAVLTSRGCPNKCSYCSTPQFYALSGAKPWRPRSPNDVVEEIQMLVEHFGVNHFHFCDDNFIGPPLIGVQRAYEIARRLIQKGLKITFEIYVRADSFHGVDESVLSLLKDAGLISALVGLEAGSQAMLDLYGKKLPLKDNKNIVHLLSKYDIAVDCGFIMFNPYVSLKDLRENADFLLEIGQTAFSRYSTNLALLPGTCLKQRTHKDGLVTSHASHFEVYNYNYRDPRIDKLARGVYIFHNPVIIEADSICTEADRIMRLIGRAIDTCYNKELPVNFYRRLLAFTKCIKQFKKNISSKYHDFFISILDLAESDWDENSYHAYKSEFLKDLKQISSRLKKTLHNAASTIHKLLHELNLTIRE